MSQTSVATRTFPSRKAASQAVDRLVSGGFARNSIALHRHEDDEGYDLEIHTRTANLRRAKRLMKEPSTMMPSMNMRSMEKTVYGAARTARSHPLILLGAGLLAGFVLYNLIPRSTAHEPASRKQPSRSGQRAGRSPRA